MTEYNEIKLISNGLKITSLLYTTTPAVGSKKKFFFFTYNLNYTI